MRTLFAILAVLALPLTGCNQNTAVGNDREAQLDPVPTPAPIVGAAAALENVAAELIKPGTMTTADIGALGGLAGRCVVRLTEVAKPSFVFEAGERGVIKLNDTLIVLPATSANRFAEGGLSVTLVPNGEEGDAGLAGMDMIVVPPRSEDELGYSGFVQCDEGDVR